MTKTPFKDRMIEALTKHEYFLAKKAQRKRQHAARVVTQRTAAGKPARADARNSQAFRAMRNGART